MKLERSDSDCYRVLGDDGAIVAFAMRLATGKWGAFGTDENRLTSKYRQFDKPKDVLAFMVENHRPA